jgi:hypothetical protein
MMSWQAAVPDDMARLIEVLRQDARDHARNHATT